MSNAAIRALAQTPLLSGLSDDHLARLWTASRRIEVAQGDQLITAGDAAQDLYLVLRGRFTVSIAGKPIADIGAGEPIGEIAFFAGGTRSADVTAARRGVVLALGRAEWEWLARDVPDIAQAILASLAQRLATATRSAPALRPLAARSVALLGDIPAPVLAALAVELPDWTILRPEGGNLRAQLYREESAGRKVLLISPPDSVLSDVDEAFDFAPMSASPSRSTAVVPSNTLVNLVLWRARDGDVIANTVEWLQLRHPARHHHIALDQPGDLARVFRFIDGRALGLVLSGGGAQGTAHLGALKAFNDQGLTFDMVGGTSAGAAMGAALALGRDPDMVMDLCEDVFLRSRAMGRFTLPKYSVLDPAHFDRALRQHFGQRMIEDMPLPYFAVATNLSTNDIAVLDRGPLWQAVRASTSIPVVFPPWVRTNGEVLVDGAMIDNAPITVMRARKPGPAVLLNLLRDTDWRSAVPYDALPGRAGAAWQVITAPLRRAAPSGFPTAITVLSRVFNVNAQRRLRGVDAPGDVMIDIHPLAGMAFLDWTKSRAQFDESYRTFSRALEKARAQGHSTRDPITFIEAAKTLIRETPNRAP